MLSNSQYYKHKQVLLLFVVLASDKDFEIVPTTRLYHLSLQWYCSNASTRVKG